MADPPPGGIDPRYPTAFQRGGGGAPVVDEGAAVRGAGTPSVRSVGASRPARVSRSSPPPPAPRGALAGSEFDVGLAEADDERHFELVVAGNPWLRALWAMGAIATLIGFALTVYAEFAFSVPPASGIYDPSVYVVPRIAEAVAQPLVIAGIIALVAAATLRIVAWRPSSVTEVIAER